MSDDLTSRFPKVPTIGLQPRKVQVAGYVLSAAIVCDCGSAKPILIPNVDKAAVCTACKQKYVIASLVFRNENGLITSNIDIAKWNGPTSASKELDVPVGDLVKQ